MEYKVYNSYIKASNTLDMNFLKNPPKDIFIAFREEEKGKGRERWGRGKRKTLV